MTKNTPIKSKPSISKCVISMFYFSHRFFHCLIQYMAWQQKWHTLLLLLLLHYICLTAFFRGQPAARDNEWQWHRLGIMQICISPQTENHASIPPLSFLQAGCPSCRPTNSVKALKAQMAHIIIQDFSPQEKVKNLFK